MIKSFSGQVVFCFAILRAYLLTLAKTDYSSICLASYYKLIKDYKSKILQRNYRKMTIKFTYNSFVKLHGKKIWEPQNDCYMKIHVKTRCVIKATVL